MTCCLVRQITDLITPPLKTLMIFLLIISTLLGIIVAICIKDKRDLRF
jgi:hypothetical protein